MYCVRCGKELDDNAKFCDKCGKRIDSDMSCAGEEKGVVVGVIIGAVIIAISVIVAAIVVISSADKAKKTLKDVEDIISDNIVKDEEIDKEDAPVEASDEKVEEVASDSGVEDVETIERSYILSKPEDEQQIENIIPSVPKWEVADDFSNVINAGDYEYYSDEFFELIKEKGFAVAGGRDGYREFYEVYEINRYEQSPNFVTVDSLMHTYHLYFAHLLKNIEKNHLIKDVAKLSEMMLDKSYSQYNQLKGTEWESAAVRNVAFFAVGNALIGTNAEIPEEVKDIVDRECSLIMTADGVEVSALMGDYEDYSQYKPRGYYEGDTSLEAYFRTMMWYGRIHFVQDDEDKDRSALLITLALDDGGIYEWEPIYTVTAFFAGASDDLGYYDYLPAVQSVYGKNVEVGDLVGRADLWEQFHKVTSKMTPPSINSSPIEEGEENVILGYRFMGQRFSVDAAIMQQLVYSSLKANGDDKRMLPDVLDVPAALGSDRAYEILANKGVTNYPNYDENLNGLRKRFGSGSEDTWRASLYAGWLNTLRPLLEEKGEGYPAFMQTKEWVDKDLETFAGSYAELKHDTVLYSKQVMAEMGGGWEEEIDDRGYVEPEPLVYSRFESLTKDTAEGLEFYGYLNDSDKENLDRLANIAVRLKEMSIKELGNEVLSEEEYEFIRDYGGEIEHFWYEVMKAQSGEEYPSTDEYPAALVVDIATDPNGKVLEVATGNPSIIYVIVEVDGRLRIAKGSAYNFYQFEQPISERMTDKEWRKAIGVEIDDYMNPDKDIKDIKKPEWTESYRTEKMYRDWE